MPQDLVLGTLYSDSDGKNRFDRWPLAMEMGLEQDVVVVVGDDKTPIE